MMVFASRIYTLKELTVPVVAMMAFSKSELLNHIDV